MKLTPLFEHIQAELGWSTIDRAGTTTKQIGGCFSSPGRSGARADHRAADHTLAFTASTLPKASVAARMTIRDSTIWSDVAGYLSIPGGAGDWHDSGKFCLACFNGDYPIPVQSEVPGTFEAPKEEGCSLGVEDQRR